MSAQEVAAVTGLDMASARRAKEREYSETLHLKGSPEEIAKVLGEVKKAGLNYASGSRYYGVMGANDKGKAAKILIDLFRRKLGEVRTVGIGDSRNDLPMLSVVDIPVLVQKVGGGWEEMEIRQLHRVEGIGPEGWAKAIAEIIKKLLVRT